MNYPHTYAAAFGGFNRIDFGRDGQVRLTPLIIDPARLEYLQNNLLFCFSGISRVSSEIHEEQVRGMKTIRPELEAMRGLVDEAHRLLNGDENDIDGFGRLLDAAWSIKKKFSTRVSNRALDDMYSSARAAGALGGKVCGAGGGGFMVFYVQPARRKAVEAALAGTLFVPVRIEYLGAHTVFYAHEAPPAAQFS